MPFMSCYEVLPETRMILWAKPTSAAVVGAAELANRRRRALERVDKELSRNNCKAALSLVKQLKAKHGGLRAFGSAKLLPKNLSIFEKLDVDGSGQLEVQSLVDSIMDSIYRISHSAFREEIEQDLNSQSILSNKEAKSSPEEDRFMVLQHESGHFLVGYLLGVLPKRYQIPDVEALRSNEPETTGRVEFVGFEFLRQVGIAKRLMRDSVNIKTHQMAIRGNISSKTLNNFSCVILGGLVTEHMLFGYSEGLHSDVDKLDSVLRWLGFTEAEADSQIRWAVSNTVFLLHCYKEARAKLAEAMDSAKPVGYCIETIENAIFNQ